MGTVTDVIVLGVASADTVTSLEQGMDPVGYAGSVVSLAGNGGQLGLSAGEALGFTTASVSTLTSISRALNGVGAVGAGLTAVQMKIDFDAGKDLKVGDYLNVGTGIVGVLVAVGVVSTSSILVPVAAIVGVAAGLSNLYGFTLSDIFAKFDELAKDRELTPAERQAVDAFVNKNAQAFDFLKIPADSNFISPICKADWDAAQRWARVLRDPLTLDLNGNGLDTIGISTTNPRLIGSDSRKQG
jgi:hypothetical protein